MWNANWGNLILSGDGRPGEGFENISSPPIVVKTSDTERDMRKVLLIGPWGMGRISERARRGDWSPCIEQGSITVECQSHRLCGGLVRASDIMIGCSLCDPSLNLLGALKCPLRICNPFNPKMQIDGYLSH